MYRILFVFILFAYNIYATDLLNIKKYSLKKDETKKILVKYSSSQKVFEFRWTLYKNDGLVVLSSYDNFPSQHMLYLNHLNQTIRIFLKPKGAYEFNVPYMLLKFDDFDFANQKAKFSLWLFDVKQEIYIKYLN